MRNQFVIDGNVIALDTIRYTPGGVAALSLTLSHQSEQLDVGSAVKVNVEMNVVAYGDLALSMAAITLGNNISVKGFLNRKNQNSRVNVLHATQFKIL